MSDSSTHLDSIRRQFTRQADAYARMRQATDERGLSGLVGLSGVRPEHRVLDVACGPGFLTMAFARQCSAAIGLDATDAFLERAREVAARAGVANVEFRSGDAEALPFADGFFDVTSCRAAFHHFPRPERVLAEMARVTRPGGRIVIADMLGSEDPAKAEARDRLERLCDPSHARTLPVSEFRRLFEAAGLEVVFEPQLETATEVEEWLDYGGPSDEARRELVAMLESSLADDRFGLGVRREDGRLRFTYAVAAFVLARD
jgi:ubiquinone/menaquinone biosynthesis C-methylase UbiE